VTLYGFDLGLAVGNAGDWEGRTMSRRRILAILVAVSGLCPAGYADTVEFTPFYGYSFSGHLEDVDTGEEFEIDDSEAYGGALDIRLTEITQLEFFYSRQETALESEEGLFAGQKLFDLDVDYYHLGGTYIFGTGPWQPFVAGTLGATVLDPDASGMDSETRFSMSLGGGVRYFPTKHLGLYAGVRGFLTFVGGDALFRSESGAVTIKVDADGFGQVQLQAGLIFAF
jgi:hypothetical protein